MGLRNIVQYIETEVLLTKPINIFKTLVGAENAKNPFRKGT